MDRTLPSVNTMPVGMVPPLVDDKIHSLPRLLASLFGSIGMCNLLLSLVPMLIFSLHCWSLSLLQYSVAFPTMVVGSLLTAWRECCASEHSDQPLPLYHERHHHNRPTAARRGVAYPTATSVRRVAWVNASARRQDGVDVAQEPDRSRTAAPPNVHRAPTAISRPRPSPLQSVSASVGYSTRAGTLHTFPPVAVADLSPCPAHLNRGPTASLPRV